MTTKTTTAERMARKMIESRTTVSLCEIFEATNSTSGEKLIDFPSRFFLAPAMI